MDTVTTVENTIRKVQEQPVERPRLLEVMLIPKQNLQTIPLKIGRRRIRRVNTKVAGITTRAPIKFDLKATWNDTGQASSSGTDEAARGKNNWSSNVEDRGGGYSGQQPHLQPGVGVGAGDTASWNNGAQWDDSALTQASQKIGAAGTAAKGSKASFVTGAIAGGKKGPQGSTETAATGEPAGAGAYDSSGATWGGGKSSGFDPTQQAPGGGANAYGYAAYDHAKNRGKGASSSSTQPPPAQQNTTGNSDQSESDRWAWAEQQHTSSWTTQKEKGGAKADAKKGPDAARLAAATPAGSAAGGAADYNYDSANYFNSGSYDNSYSWSEAGAAKGTGAGATSSTSQGVYAHKKGAPRPGFGGPDQWYGAASQADNSGANYYQAPGAEGGAAPGAGAYSQQSSQVPHTAKGKSEAFGGKPADPSSKGGKASSVGGKKKATSSGSESRGADQALPHTVSSASAEEPATYDPRDYSYAYGYATAGAANQSDRPCWLDRDHTRCASARPLNRERGLEAGQRFRPPVVGTGTTASRYNADVRDAAEYAGCRK
eukprot:g7629.t1